MASITQTSPAKIFGRQTGSIKAFDRPTGPSSQHIISNETSEKTVHNNTVHGAAGDEQLEDGSLRRVNNEPINNSHPSGTNVMYTVFLIVNAALGAGLLNFPKSIDEAGGILVATAVQLVLLAFIMVALLALAYAADQCGPGGATTIQETMEGMTGRWGSTITSACVVVYTFGTTITFLIIIGDQFDGTFSAIYGSKYSDYWYMTRTFTISACSCLLILPLCYSKRIDFLRIPSSLGVIAIVYLVGLIIYEYYFGNYIPGPIKVKPTKVTDAFLVVPVICFGYQCHVSVIPIYSCMKRRTLANFTYSASLAIGICVACYTLAAIFGYLTFGSNVKDDILMSYNGGGLVYAGRCAMALKIITTYPILLFCGREALKSVIVDLESIFARRNTQDIETNKSGTVILSKSNDDLEDASQTKDCQWGERKEILVRYISVTVWFGLSLILALSISNIGSVIKMLGSLAAVFIFIFPGLCMLKCIMKYDPSFLRKRSWAIIVASFVFMAIGGFIFGIVFVQAIQSFAE